MPLGIRIMTEATDLIASVAVAAPLPQPLSYLVPSHLRERVGTGSRVIVPLGRRQAAGCVLCVTLGDGSGLKELVDAPDDDALFPATMIPFLLRAADYYHNKYGQSPNMCLVNEAMLQEAKQVGTIQVRPVQNVLNNHFWVGIQAF